MLLSRRALLAYALGASIDRGRYPIGVAKPPSAGSLANPWAEAAARGAEVIRRGETAYDEARRVFLRNPQLEYRPELISRCSTDRAVIGTLAAARATGMDISVRSGGHDIRAASIAGRAVIDLGTMQSIELEPEGIVRIGAGVRAGKLSAYLQERGRIAALGTEARVGVAGLTLGGGMGWLAGRHGAACDNLVGATLITAAGERIEVTDRSRPELIWALRGAGANFGVVTELRLKTHPRREASQGIVAIMPASLRSFLPAYYDLVANAGDDTDFETFLFPVDGRPLAFVKFSSTADEKTADRVKSQLCRLGRALAVNVARRPYEGIIDPTGAVQGLFRLPTERKGSDDRPGQHWLARSVTSVVPELASAIDDAIAKAPGPWIFGFGHLFHGRAARVGLPSALRRSPGELTIHLTSYWRRSEDAAARSAWSEQTMAAIGNHSKATYLNLLSSDRFSDVAASYGSSWAPLRQLKRHYDPDNVFRHNRNIRPA